MSLDGVDAECGSHETGGNWYGLMTDTGIKGAEHVIVVEDNQGFFDYKEFASKDEAESIFEQIERDEEDEGWAEDRVYDPDDDDFEDPWPKSELDVMEKGKTHRREPKRRDAMWKADPSREGSKHSHFGHPGVHEISEKHDFKNLSPNARVGARAIHGWSQRQPQTPAPTAKAEVAKHGDAPHIGNPATPHGPGRQTHYPKPKEISSGWRKAGTGIGPSLKPLGAKAEKMTSPFAKAQATLRAATDAMEKCPKADARAGRKLVSKSFESEHDLPHKMAPSRSPYHPVGSPSEVLDRPWPEPKTQKPPVKKQSVAGRSGPKPNTTRNPSTYPGTRWNPNPHKDDPEYNWEPKQHPRRSPLRKPAPWVKADKQVGEYRDTPPDATPIRIKPAKKAITPTKHWHSTPQGPKHHTHSEAGYHTNEQFTPDPKPMKKHEAGKPHVHDPSRKTKDILPPRPKPSPTTRPSGLTRKHEDPKNTHMHTDFGITPVRSHPSGPIGKPGYFGPAKKAVPDPSREARAPGLARQAKDDLRRVQSIPIGPEPPWAEGARTEFARLLSQPETPAKKAVKPHGSRFYGHGRPDEPHSHGSTRHTHDPIGPAPRPAGVTPRDAQTWGTKTTKKAKDPVQEWGKERLSRPFKSGEPTPSIRPRPTRQRPPKKDVVEEWGKERLSKPFKKQMPTKERMQTAHERVRPHTGSQLRSVTSGSPSHGGVTRHTHAIGTGRPEGAFTSGYEFGHHAHRVAEHKAEKQLPTKERMWRANRRAHGVSDSSLARVEPRSIPHGHPDFAHGHAEGTGQPHTQETQGWAVDSWGIHGRRAHKAEKMSPKRPAGETVTPGYGGRLHQHQAHQYPHDTSVKHHSGSGYHSVPKEPKLGSDKPDIELMSPAFAKAQDTLRAATSALGKAGPRPVSRATASLLGYKSPKDVPFKIQGPHGTPVHERPADSFTHSHSNYPKYGKVTYHQHSGGDVAGHAHEAKGFVERYPDGPPPGRSNVGTPRKQPLKPRPPHWSGGLGPPGKRTPVKKGPLPPGTPVDPRSTPWTPEDAAKETRRKDRENRPLNTPQGPRGKGSRGGYPPKKTYAQYHGYPNKADKMSPEFAKAQASLRGATDALLEKHDTGPTSPHPHGRRYPKDWKPDRTVTSTGRPIPRSMEGYPVKKHETEENPGHSHNPQGGHFAPTVHTEQFEWSHGKKPRGTGGWAFQFDKDSEPYFPKGSLTYAEAKRQAMAEGRRRGASRIHTLP